MTLVQSTTSEPTGLGVENLAVFDEIDSERIHLREIYRPEIDAPPGTPREYSRILFSSRKGEFVSGVWQGEPGTHLISSFPVDEFCHVIDGAVVLTDHTGCSRTFRRGMGFVIPRGFAGTLHVAVRTRKYFAAFGDPAMIAFLIGRARG